MRVSAIFIINVMLFACSVHGDQAFDKRVHFLLEDQPNLFDQRFQDDLERDRFAYQQVSLEYEKMRNLALIGAGGPIVVGTFLAMLSLLGRKVALAGAILSSSCIPCLITIPVSSWAAWQKYIADLKIDQYSKKLAEHRLKMACLGRCSLTLEQIEDYEQKMQELELKRRGNDAADNGICDPQCDAASNSDQSSSSE